VNITGMLFDSIEKRLTEKRLAAGKGA
jgi:hypothetical protein